jgi:quinol monooxygenase YgiN
MSYAVVTFELALKPEAAAPFLAQLPAILDETRTKPGFLDISAQRQQDAPERLLLIERWESADDYRAYLQWRIDTGLLEALKPLITEEPRIRIWDAPWLTIGD